MPAGELQIEFDAAEAIRYVEDRAAEFDALGREPTPEEFEAIEEEARRRLVMIGVGKLELSVAEIDAQLQRMTEAHYHRLERERAECEFCQEAQALVGETN